MPDCHSIRLGHRSVECTNNRAEYLADVRDESPEEAWNLLKAADKERDLFQVREVRNSLFVVAFPRTATNRDFFPTGGQNLCQGRTRHHLCTA